jgi:DNA sulfur modification protein DndD
MKIERVILTNFRQYYGEQRVAFSQDDTKNVTVIHGVNGAGKTSFFIALNWCLYGEGIDNIGQVISKEAVSKAKVGEWLITKVAIHFRHEGYRYVATRQMSGLKRKDNTISEVREVDFVLLRTGADGIAQKIPNPIGVINTILPNNVRTYFFFDGEKIDRFARPESAEEVKWAVYQVLDLEVMTRAKNHLATAARELRTELRSVSSGELQELVARDQEARQLETEYNKQLAHLRSEITATQKHLGEINQHLRDLDAVQALQKQYDLFTEEMREREGERERMIHRIRDFASQSYITLSQKALSKALGILDAKRQRGEIPSNIRQQFVEDLLQQRVCICGRPFAEHDDAYQHLARFLKTSMPTLLEDDVLNTTGSLKGLIDRGTQIRHDLDEAMSDKVRLDQTIERLIAQRDDVQRQMAGSEHLEVSKLAKQRDEYQVDIDTYRAEVLMVEKQLEAVRVQIKDLERQMEQARKTEYKEQLLSRKIRLAQEAADVIENFHAVFAENKRREIEQESRTIFHSLAWKGEHFQDVRLTADYQLEVTDRYGLPARPELSAGERQVLSLSFITAMAKVAQREAPLIMDTPFGRLSSAHREAITANLPVLAPQLVLFVTDEELRDRALDNLMPRIGTEYRLDFNVNTSCTKVEELR